MYTFKFPLLLRWAFSGLQYTLPATNEIFLTFDDGPIPEVTPEVLNILAHYRMKATFFCVGENIDKHPDIFKKVVDKGHAVGNHTYHHLDGWKHSSADYVANVDRCYETMQVHGADRNKSLFRPPYGKITPALIKLLKSQYQIVMWDLIAADFDLNLSPQKSLHVLKKSTKPGSIIVFHDSIKAADNMLTILPAYIQFIKEKGWTSAAIV